MEKLIITIEIANINSWDTNWNDDYQKLTTIKELNQDMKHSISKGCGIPSEDIKISSIYKNNK